jgi:hypothetical protein
MPLSLLQARNDLLSKLGVEDSSLATALMLQDVVIALNAALQTLQTAGEDYFTREIIDATFTAGSTFVTLSASVQNVIGPIRITSGPNTGMPLLALQSKGEIDQFGRIFQDQTSWLMTAGEPTAYWVENLRNGNDGEINEIRIRPAPVPTANRNFQVEVVNDAPSYAVTDLSSGTTYLPVAQNYAESLLLPIARLNVTRSSQFSRPELLPQITEDAQRAMQELGMAGGFPVEEEKKEPPRKTKG